MAAHDFEFSIDVSGPAAFDEMFRALTAQVVDHVGAGDVVAGVAEPLRAAIDKAVGSARGCRVWFRRHGGTLDIEVTSGAERIWQLSKPIP